MPADERTAIVMVRECVFTMSDPRLTGTGEVTANYDCPGGDPCFFWGTGSIKGPSGGWDCPWVAMEPPPKHDSVFFYGVCPGTGGYEGLTFVYQQVLGGDYLGYIYEGPPPVEIVPAS
jgi:hypothetical protein